MKVFAVYEHPVDGLCSIARGFSAPALLLGPLWLLSRRLWPAAAVFTACLGLAVWLEGQARAQNDVWLVLAVYWSALTLLLVGWLIPGFFGPSWAQERLLDEGFQFVQEVAAQDHAAAVARVEQLRRAALNREARLPRVSDPDEAPPGSGG